jgi:hypothetical protein
MIELFPFTQACIKRGDMMIDYAKEYGIKVFCETGTYAGGMIEHMDAGYQFDKIISIELSHPIYAQAALKFAGKKHIHLYQGDSGDVLKTLVFDQPTLFWLDAHFSHGATARGPKLSPILEELDTVLNDMPHVILIDDLNLMPKWGITIDKLLEHIANLKPKAGTKIIGDVMVITPCI